MPAPKGHPPYNKNGEGGRPPLSLEYVEQEADAFEKWMELPDSLYFKDFALERGYLPQNLTLLAKKSERFAFVYKKAQEWQESKLVKGGLKNNFNAGFTKFVLGNTCGWSERSEQRISGDASNPLVLIMNQTKDMFKESEEEERSTY